MTLAEFHATETESQIILFLLLAAVVVTATTIISLVLFFMKAYSALNNDHNYDRHLAEKVSKLIVINAKIKKLAQQEAKEQTE